LKQNFFFIVLIFVVFGTIDTAVTNEQNIAKNRQIVSKLRRS